MALGLIFPSLMSVGHSGHFQNHLAVPRVVGAFGSPLALLDFTGDGLRGWQG